MLAEIWYTENRIRSLAYSYEYTNAANNPFTYRGYYFDRDLNLYCLGTRYYDYNTGRFINADTVVSGANGSLSGYNLYAYCFNNPIMLTDEAGAWPKWAKKIAKAAKSVANAVVDAVVDVVVDVTVKVVVAAAESVEIQVGFGFAKETNLGHGVKMEVSRNNYIGLDDGKITTGTCYNTSLSLGGVDISVSCDNLSEKGGEIVSRAEINNMIDEFTNPDAEYTAAATWGMYSLNSKGELLVGWQDSFYYGVGGYYSAQFNVSEFFVRLFE